MSIITISADAYSNGRELAESVARKMACPCIGEDITSAASELYQIPEERLIGAQKKGVSIFDRFTAKKQKYIACLEAALATQMLNPNLVYYGFVGLPWFQKVSHILKVRIIANLEDRIPVAIKSEKLQGRVEALDRIFKEDEGLRRWGKRAYDINIADSFLYDLVINLGRMGADDAEDAGETIASTVRHKKFQPMTYSLNCMKDIALSLGLKAALLETDPKIQIKSDRGAVYLYSKTFRRKKPDQILDFKGRVMKHEGVRHVEIYGKKEIFDRKSRGY